MLILLGVLLYFHFYASSNDHNFTENKFKNDLFKRCNEQDIDCIREKLNYDAIELIHGQIDEDHDGVVELNETKDFLKEELNITDSDKKSSAFHITDSSISVSEFWILWKSSEAHNWTETQVLDWLVNHVKLPQYINIFKRFRVSGKDIPRLATNVSFKSKILGITDPISRKRLQLMALDIVLFGSPLNVRHVLKDFLVVVSLIVAALGLYFAYSQNAKFHRERSLVWVLKEKIENNIKELESLSTLKETESECDLSTESGYMKCGIDMPAAARAQLVAVLSRTYEVEYKYIKQLRVEIDSQVITIRDQADKFSRKRANSVFSAIKYGYFNPFNEIDTKIILAKKSVEDFNESFREFKQRWRLIMELCGGSIIQKDLDAWDSKSTPAAYSTLEEKSIPSIIVDDSTYDVTTCVKVENKSQKPGFIKKRKKK